MKSVASHPNNANNANAISASSARNFLTAIIQKASAAGHIEIAQHFSSFESLYDRKLWHQLTLAIDAFLAHPQSRPYLIPLYENFITDFEKKLNKLKLVAGIGILGARQLEDPKSAIQFLYSLAAKCKPNDEKPKDKDDEKAVPDQTALEAYILCVMEASHYHLRLNEFDKVLEHVKSCEPQLDELAGVEPRVSATFYRVSADYYKAKSDYTSFYKTALLFLSCIPNLDMDLSPIERSERAHDLALASLLSDSIYSFGELLMHPILDALKGTPHEWLCQLLNSFKYGDIGKFEGLGGHFSKQPLLMQNMGFLRQKICIMALMEAVFKRKSHDRVLSFDVIARETRLPVEEVEHLVMKALSLKLIKGSIDQVDQNINVSWVQPRVVDKAQIKVMSGLLSDWLDRVGETTTKMEDQGKDLFISA